MFLTLFTAFHVLISLIAILAGLVVVAGLIMRTSVPKWTLLFLVTTVATSITGFLFPVHHFTPAHGVGIVSMGVLILAIVARYRNNLRGYWRQTYVVMATLSLYLNALVLVVQAFLKVPALKSLAPTQAEPPFKITQLILLSCFLTIAVFELIRFREPTLSHTTLASQP